ncbi:MAG: putative toxin-antitoxin system toxin component, PIN family [Proteobacteria bacterium]|nr:putative toxin-antitoxin system toxin component, PIN family [Pseudomonadota bacterium]
MPTIKAVIDTSVMVSVAFAKEGLAKKLRDLIADEAFTLVTSKDMLTELYRMLHYPHILKRFKPTQKDVDAFIAMIIEHANITEGTYSLNKIKDDPSDDMFLACAVEAQADFIISRDPHLRNVKQFQGIRIIDLTTFLEQLKKKK